MLPHLAGAERIVAPAVLESGADLLRMKAMAKIAHVEDTDTVGRAVQVLRAGGLVVLPLDGVYALVADEFQTDATQRLLDVKRRGREVPLPLLTRTPRRVIGPAQDVPESAERLMASFRPGPVTLLLSEQPTRRGTLATPVHASAAPVLGRPGPRCGSGDRSAGVQRRQRRGRDVADDRRPGPRPPRGRFELYVDDGALGGTLSTIVDCSRDDVAVLREGAIARDEIVAVASGDVGWGQRPAEGA